jgi:gas vesicle structural protein
MTMASRPSALPGSGGGGGNRGPSGSSLADVVDTILDKGVVIDAQIGISVVGIQLITIDARVVVASIDTYLRFAEAVNRLDIMQNQGKGLNEVLEGTTKAVGNATKAVGGTTKAVEGTTTDGAVGKAGELLGELVEPSEKRQAAKRGGRRR